MPWFKTSDAKPSKDERLLVHDDGRNRIETGLEYDPADD